MKKVSMVPVLLALSVALATSCGWSQTIPLFPFEDNFDDPIDDDDPVTWVQQGPTEGESEVTDGSLIFSASGGSFGVSKAGGTVVVQDMSAQTQLRLGGANEATWAGIWARGIDRGVEFFDVYAGGIQKGGTLFVGEQFSDGEVEILTTETALSPETHDVIIQLETLGNTITVSAWDARDNKPSQVSTLSYVDDTLVEGMFGLGIGGGSGSAASFRWFEVAPAWSPGDFNGDDLLDVVDIDQLTAQIALGTTHFLFDLNGDTTVDHEDRRFWVEELKRTFFGDGNLDGRVDANDLNTLALNWQRTNVISWAEGDFNGDGSANAGDLNQLALNWRRGATAPAVPEPAGASLLLVGLFVVQFRRHARRISEDGMQQPPDFHLHICKQPCAGKQHNF